MNKLLTFVLAAMAFVACTQNEVEELSANRADIPETLTVGFEGGDTRVELNEALKTVWTEGDEVSVFYRSYENMRWAFQGATGDRSGDLKRVSGEVGAQTMDNVVVVYPYSDAYMIDVTNGGVEASLPAVQSYKDGSYGAEGNIMVAESKFTQFVLKSVVGWLRVELTGEGEVVESVKVRGNNGEQIAGLCYIDAADASVTLASNKATNDEDGDVSGNLNFDGSMLTEVVLDCGDGVELGAEATEFYIALLPQTFEKGMTVEVGYANGNSQALVYENVITISRNHISPIGIEANEETDVPTNQLWYTATALVEPYDTSAFNVAIVSNEWDEATGEGVITFAGELTTIGDWAFWNCNSLTSVTIPDSVTTIGEGIFERCSSLTSVVIPDSVTTIGEAAFYYCSSLTSVTIPDSVTTIGYEAFRYCESLTSVTIPDSVTTIGDSAFYECTSLTSVTIGDSVTTIGNFAFYACHSLAEFKGKFAADDGRCLIKDNAIIAYAEASGTTYTIPDYVTTIGDGAFSNCNSLTSVTIPDSVTTIGDHAFYGCSSLTSVTIPDSVTTIGDSVFYDCDSLTSVTIPDSVTTIGNHAFRNCDSLTSVTIGDSVTAIGVMAFCGCKSLTSVYCKAAAPPHIGGDVFDENSTDRKIYVYEECVDAYKTAWSEFADSIIAGGNIPESVTTTILYTTSDGAVIDASKFPVKSHTYNNCVGELILYGELKAIPDRAFYEFGTLTTITIPDSVTTIGDYAFDGCTSLTSVTIGDSVTAIGDRAFYYCDSLTSVTIPDSVTTIGEEVFYACDDLTKVTIGDSVTTIGRGTFSDCTSLTSVTIGDSVTTIGDSAFRDCRSLTSVTIPDSVTTIGYEAFRNCDDLTSVTIGDSVTTIGGSAFYYCSSLTSVTIPDSVTTIGNFAFYACHSLAEFKGKFAADDGRCLIKDNTIIAYANASGTTYTIPNSVTTIGEAAFSNCNSLTSVTIPDSITAIGEGVFFYCDSLTSVYCKATTPPTLGNDVFKTWTLSNGYVNLGCAIYVPAESVEEYKAATNWSEYADYIVGYNFETGEEVAISNKLFYTATALVEPNNTSAFNVAIVSNEWDETTGEGVITFDGELTTIGNWAFYYCRSLTSVVIPDSVTTIGDDAFRDCDSITSVTIGNSVTTIGDYAFRDCDSLTSVTIGNSVTTIGDGVFADCSNLAEFKGKFAADGGRCLIKDNTIIAYAEASGTTYTIPDSVTTIGDEAFYGCNSLTSVTIPDSVTKIGQYAFYYCRSLTSVTIGESVTTIRGNAFSNCTSLTSVTIPDSVTTIGESAFYYCSNLKSVTIPDSVTTIEGDAFYNCTSLTSVYCKATTPPTLDGSSVFDSNKSGRKIYVPAESVEAYKAAENWSEYAADIVGYDFE